jgi:uncharacterized protein (TIGR04255 family)
MPEDHKVHYERPPVVETVYSAQFDPLERLNAAHLGAFWHTVRHEWPQCSVAAPIESAFERFGQERVWDLVGRIQLRLAEIAPMRLQLQNKDQDRMLQVQNDRVVLNWTRKGNDYPRDRAIRPEFFRWLGAFRHYVQEYDLGALRLNQWEVTYVNHIPAGTVWKTTEDWAGLFPGSGIPPVALHVSALEGIGVECKYALLGNRGRLHVELRNVRIGGPAGTDALLLKLTARGPVGDDQSEAGLLQGIELGHECIVQSFDRLVSKGARIYWGRIDEHD